MTSLVTILISRLSRNRGHYLNCLQGQHHHLSCLLGKGIDGMRCVYFAAKQGIRNDMQTPTRVVRDTESPFTLPPWFLVIPNSSTQI